MMPAPIQPNAPHERLSLAIELLSRSQIDRLLAAQAEQGIAGGLKMVIGSLAGLPTPSVLSDMLAGRTRGLRHFDGLGRVLGIDPAWLRCEDHTPPDFLLSPLDAWERLCQQIANAWRAQIGALRTEEDSQSEPKMTAADRAHLAELFGLKADDVRMSALASFKFGACDFDLVLHVAARLGLPKPSHPEHLRTGYDVAHLLAERIADALAQAKRRQTRYLMPPRLFVLVRQALSALKAQRALQGKDIRPVDDCLEMLWRQEQLRLGRPRQELPEGFTRETGRRSWQALSQFPLRYANTASSGDLPAAKPDATAKDD